MYQKNKPLTSIAWVSNALWKQYNRAFLIPVKDIFPEPSLCWLRMSFLLIQTPSTPIWSLNLFCNITWWWIITFSFITVIAHFCEEKYWKVYFIASRERIIYQARLNKRFVRKCQKASTAVNEDILLVKNDASVIFNQ